MHKARLGVSRDGQSWSYLDFQFLTGPEITLIAVIFESCSRFTSVGFSYFFIKTPRLWTFPRRGRCYVLPHIVN